MDISVGGNVMERISVKSSNINSIGYDETSKILEIEFNSGWIYQYYEVPLEVYQKLMNAPSHGKYFHVYIKTGPYNYKRIR